VTPASVGEGARPATAADLVRVTELHRSATAELRAQKGGEVWAATTGRNGEPDLRLEADDLHVLVGMFEEAVVGYARVERRALPDGGALAVLTDIYVEPEARGVGVGEALLDEAIAWAREVGCRGIDSTALPGMRDTKNFFEAAGLVARAITVHRRL
jgi:GNAT superfamily N-acetyltransferase